jgi:hypothetical protein
MRLLFLRIDFNRTWCIIQITATFGIYCNPASNWIDKTTEKKPGANDCEYLCINKGNNKITELWAILQRESKNS